MAPKDKEPILKKSGVIYRYKCDRVECDEEYIGKLARTFAERFKEYLKAPSPIYDHYITSGHTVTIDNSSIVGREDQNLMRTIKEALYIRVKNPSLNRNIGKYHLPNIWDEVLLNILELKLKYKLTQWLFHLQLMAITSANASIPTLVGYSISHLGNNICHITATCILSWLNICHIQYNGNICHLAQKQAVPSE